MQLVAIDVGTGTQDVLVWDTEQTIENALQLVLPSPTAQLAQQVRAATRRGVGLALSGVIMGGGPGHWAINDHLEAGYPVYATPVAAQTFNDDLATVREMGIILVSEDE
nr:pyruvate formate lyase-activating protein [Herpetosiphonaceae bacterium]